MAASGVGEEVRGGGIEQKGERTHGLGQPWGDCWGVGGIRGLNGNGKINKIFLVKTNLCFSFLFQQF